MAITRRRFTRTEYYRMVEAGILGKRDRVELIRSDIVEKFPMSTRHHAFVMNLSMPLIVRLDGRARVSVGTAVALADDTDTEPDLAVLRIRMPSFKIREPYAEDALLVIEVADVSLAYDRTTKLRLYAEAGIPEYWIVDCTAETVEVYRNRVRRRLPRRHPCRWRGNSCPPDLPGRRTDAHRDLRVDPPRQHLIR